MALLMPPRTPTALVHLCIRRDARPTLASTIAQRSKAWCQDEGHSPKNGLEPPGQGTKGCPKPGCPIPQRAAIPQEPPPRRGEASMPGAEQRKMKKHPKPGGVGAAPWCPGGPRHSRPAQQRLINHSAPRRDGGPRPPAANPRSVTTETTLTLHRLQRVLCVCLCVLLRLPPPPLVVFFVCVCARKKELGFFLFPGKRLAPGLSSCEKRGQDRRTDRQTEEPGEPATIAQRLGRGGSSEKKVGGHRGGCGANESKINIYMGRVLKPYFASL